MRRHGHGGICGIGGGIDGIAGGMGGIGGIGGGIGGIGGGIGGIGGIGTRIFDICLGGGDSLSGSIVSGIFFLKDR